MPVPANCVHLFVAMLSAFILVTCDCPRQLIIYEMCHRILPPILHCPTHRYWEGQPSVQLSNEKLLDPLFKHDSNIWNYCSTHRVNVHVWQKFQIDAFPSNLKSKFEGGLWGWFTFISGCRLTDGQTQSVTVCFLSSLSAGPDPNISWVACVG